MSRNLFLFIFLSFLSPSVVSAQSEIIELKDVKKVYEIGSEIEFLEDKEGTIDFEDLQKPEISKQFKKSNQKTLNFGNSKSDFWLRFKLKDPYVTNDEWLINIKNNFIDTLNIYQVIGDSVVYEYYTGDAFSFSQRVVSYRHFVFPIRFKKNQEMTVYIHFRGVFGKQFPIEIAEESRFFKSVLINDSIIVAVISALIALALYNLFLYFSLWEKHYITYVVLILSFILALVSFTGFLIYFVPNSPKFNNLAPNSFASLAAYLTVFLL